MIYFGYAALFVVFLLVGVICKEHCIAENPFLGTRKRWDN